MIRPAVPDLSYLAGFFDGEGSLMLIRNKERRPRPTIAVTNTDLLVLGHYQNLFGGSINPLIDTRNRDRPMQPLNQWRASGPTAYGAVKAMQPYLRVKFEQAKFWLDAFEELTDGPRIRPRDLEREAWLVTTLSAMKRQPS